MTFAPSAQRPASYVIARRDTGRAVQEVFGPEPVLHGALAATCEVVPIMEWLQRVAAEPEKFADER